MPYEILSHTADTGIEATAPSLPKLVDELATGMFRLMAPVDPCPSDDVVEIDVTAHSDENLIIDTLSELLYEAEVEDLILCGFETTIIGRRRLHVTASGSTAVPFDFSVGQPEAFGRRHKT